MRPRFAPAPEFGVGGWNCVWFQVLKTSPRSSSLTSSRDTTNDFCAPISQVLTPGPLSTVGPLTPKKPTAGTRKHSVSNQRNPFFRMLPESWLLRPSQTRLGRELRRVLPV
jgi:hypothetical protein